jgi:hypothetical protein
MKVTAVARPSPVSFGIDSRVTAAVNQALQAVRTSGPEFAVNDSLWFAENDRGKVTPCVMNSAKFISKKFLAELNSIGWTTEKSIVEQTIDAYVEIEDAASDAFRVSADRFHDYFSVYARTDEGASAVREVGGLWAGPGSPLLAHEP